jgi:hypothetical protein
MHPLNLLLTTHDRRLKTEKKCRVLTQYGSTSPKKHNVKTAPELYLHNARPARPFSHRTACLDHACVQKMAEAALLALAAGPPNLCRPQARLDLHKLRLCYVSSDTLLRIGVG